MNAQTPNQTSGNEWLSPLQANTFSQNSQGLNTFLDPRQSQSFLADLEKQMADFALQYEAAVVEVRRNFVVPAEASVTTFLTEHRTIVQILLEAATELRKYFGAETIFNLRAPIDESGSRTLYAVAMWPGEVRDVREALANFDNTWWLAHARNASGHLTFTYELV